MKRLIYIIASLLLCIAVNSCDFLEQKPIDTIAPEDYYKTTDDIENALTGVYSSLARSGLYQNNMMGKLGLSADIGFANYSSEKGTVTYNSVIASDTKILTYWQDCYRGIERANMLLKYIDNAEIEEDMKIDVKGQALFLRSYFYLLLVTRFGDVPLILNSTESGNPEHVHVSRTDMRTVYHRIISDLEAAADMVKDISEIPAAKGTRATKSAVWGILARACLYMAGEPLLEDGMYAKAREYAGKVIGSNHHRLNPSFEQVFINYIQDKYDIKESIFEVDFYGNGTGVYANAAGQVGRNNGIKFSNVDVGQIGTSIGILQSSDYYHKLFGAGDLRRDWTIAPFLYDDDGTKTYEDMNGPAWKLYCGKFRREYELSNPKTGQWTTINFPILRYSDVLLMYAESVAADSQSTEGEFIAAKEYVNQVRRRGYGKDINTADPDADIELLSKEELLEHIKVERALELGFEMLRKDDIIRWGEYYSRMQHVKGLAHMNTYTSSCYVSSREFYSNASERDVLWPIPSYEIGQNPELKQNKGW